jgi:CRP-like cAMP-binding protein
MTLLGNDWLRLAPVDLAGAAAGWDVVSARPGAEDHSEFWSTLAHGVDPRYEHPEARQDVIIERLPDEKGAILTDEKRGVYTQIAAEDLYLWERMDGSRTQIDLVVDLVMKFKMLSPARIAGLVESLRAQGLLTEPPDELYQKLRIRLQQSTTLGRINAFTQTILRREFAISGVDTLVGIVYQRGGWIFYTLPILIAFIAISVTGLAAFLYLLTRHEFSILGEGDLVQGAAVLVAFQFLSIFLHEWAHALTVKAFGRKVRRAGFFLLFGLPGVFIDTTDIWPAGKRAQMAVTWAGPFSNLILGGIAALFIIANPQGDNVPLAFQFAVSQYSLVVLNLTPFIRLDGYYLLADFLGIANLNQRSSGFLRRGLPSKWRNALQEGNLFPKLTREEIVLVVFGALSALWIANLLGLAVLTAPVRMVKVITSAITGKLAGASPVTLGLTLVGIFFTILMFFRATNWVRQWIQQIARAFQTSAVWRMALLFGVIGFTIASIPDVLVWRDTPVATALIYALFLSLFASGLVFLFAVRLARELRGARLQIISLGTTLTGLILVVVDTIGCFNILLSSVVAPETLDMIAALSLIPMVIASLFAISTVALLTQAPLRWGMILSILGGLCLLAHPFASIPMAAMFLAISGRTLIAASLILHYGLLYRPLALPRVAQVVTQLDPAELLAGAIKSIVRELTQSLGEISGRPALLELVADFNAYAARINLPFWLTMNGTLGDQTSGEPAQRAPEYRALIADLREHLAERLGQSFARDAYAQALAELPLLSRMVVNRWLVNSEPNGLSDQVDDDRVRLRLAGRRVAETLVISASRIYGWRQCDEIIGRFNRMAASAGWPLYLRGNGRVADELSGNLLEIAQIYGDALQDLIGRVIRVTGVLFAERALLQVYDSLPWEVREVASHTLFSRLSWTRKLVDEEAVDPRVEFLQTVPILGMLSAHELSGLTESLSVRSVHEGRVVFPAGMYLSRLGIVHKGHIHAVVEEDTGTRTVEQIGPSGLIGLRSLAENQPVPYRYEAHTDVELWEIDPVSVLPQLVMLLRLQDETTVNPEVLNILARNPLFSRLDARQRVQLASRMEQQELPVGHVVLQEGQPSQGFYLVQSGELHVLVTAVDGTERHLSNLGTGEFFGEIALMTNSNVSATIRTSNPCVLLRLPADDFQELIMDNLGASLDMVQSRRAKERVRVQQMVVAAPETAGD